MLVLLIVLLIIFSLLHNKKKLDEANKPADRSAVPVSVSVATSDTGTIQLNTSIPALLKPLDEANITSQTSGIISFLDIELGQQVKKGEVIGKLDTRILEINLKSAQLTVSTAAVNKRTAEINYRKLLQDYERAKDLYENKAGLEISVNTAKNSYENALAGFDNAATAYRSAIAQVSLIKQQIANCSIIAPMNGIVSVRNSKQGEFVSPGTSIAIVTNTSKLKVTLYADQQTAYQLKFGQEGIISSPLFGEKKLSGQIIFISPKADINHNYQADLLITNNEGIALKAGTDVTVSFNLLARHGVLQIPEAALVTDRPEPFVFVAENGQVKGKTLKTGLVYNGWVEIISGLTRGESVVISGQINLKEGSQITIIK
jgi:membrane fusion protein, multidrug efflux system